MLFTSPLFLYFFVAVLGIHALLPKGTARKAFLLAASYVFYAAWEFPTGGYLLSLLISSGIVNYYAGNFLLDGNGPQSRAQRRGILLLALCFNLGILITFKYLGFFAETINGIIGLLHGQLAVPVPRIVLPLGISFFTFQAMQYSIAAYQRKCRPYPSLFDFLLFVAFFPQLIAGPIVRSDHFLDELAQKRETNWRAVDQGMRIALVGLLLKVVLADNAAVRVDPMFAKVGSLTPLDALIATYGFSMQIYCDFAGYSLIATGLARCFGILLPENFDMPYLSTGFVEFWRRWHITLSTWLRDFLYIPLGGSRHGPGRTGLALLITMFLGGLWHGASWNFVLWGLGHGIMLVIAHFLRAAREPSEVKPKSGWLRRAAAVFLTFHGVTFLWVLFRANTLPDAITLYKLLLRVPGQLIGSRGCHYESYCLIPFLAVFALYHLIARKQAPEKRVLALRPIPAAIYLLVGWLCVEIFHVGEVSFIYFAF